MLSATVWPQATWIPCLHTKKSLNDKRTHGSWQRLTCLIFVLKKCILQSKNVNSAQDISIFLSPLLNFMCHRTLPIRIGGGDAGMQQGRASLLLSCCTSTNLPQKRYWSRRDWDPACRFCEVLKIPHWKWRYKEEKATQVLLLMSTTAIVCRGEIPGLCPLEKARCPPSRTSSFSFAIGRLKTEDVLIPR